MPGSIALVAVGLVVLIIASDRLVVAAVRVSRRLGISAVLIGALVVGLGTSIPELLVSVIASNAGELDVAMTNVVGSNVANVTLVLGVAALLAPIVAQRRIVRREGVLMALAVAGLAAVLVDGEVTTAEGIGLLVAMGISVALLAVWSRGVSHDAGDLSGVARSERPLRVEIGIGLVALVATVVGANFLLDGAIDIGERLELSDTFLGFLLGVGTSLPELATSVAAARRREADLVLGNIVGSNLFNSLAVAGLAAVVGPGVLAELEVMPLVLMILTITLAGIFSRSGDRVTRIEGLLLFVAFLGFGLVAF